MLESVFFILVVAFNLTLGFPFTVGCWWLFIKYRNRIFFRKRRRRLVIGLMITLSLTLLIYPLLASIALSNFVIQGDKVALQRVIDVVWCALVDALLYMSALRAWLIQFEKRLRDSMKQEPWRYVLNPEAGDWVVQHASEYGSVHWLFNRSVFGFIPAVILSSVLSAMAIGNPTIGFVYVIVKVLYFSIASGFLTWVACKLGDFGDFFYVKNELSSFVLGLLGLMVVFVIHWIIRLTTGNQDPQIFIPYIILLFCSAFCLCFMIYTMTFQVVSRNQQGKDNTNNELEKRLHAEINLSTAQISDLSVIEDWKMYIQNNQNFNFFIQFLIRAFCVENLLFVAEVVQFKKAISIDIHQTVIPGWNLADWPSEVPDAFADLVHPVDWMLKASILYQKYIRRDKAPFEINVSHVCRQELERFFEDYIAKTPGGQGPTQRNSVHSDDMGSSVIPVEEDGVRKKRSEKAEECQRAFDKALKEADDLLRDMYGKYRLMFAKNEIQGN